VQSSRENHPVKCHARSRSPISVPQQEAPQQSKNENLELAFYVTEEEKVGWCYVWGIWGMHDKSDLSLRRKVEDDVGSVASSIVGANDQFAFACWS
jgi:hypothetical protein